MVLLDGCQRVETRLEVLAAILTVEIVLARPLVPKRVNSIEFCAIVAVNNRKRLWRLYRPRHLVCIQARVDNQWILL